MLTGPGRPSPWRNSPRPSPEAVEDDRRTVPPGGVIGIVGGGQLGRMAALAAASLGYRSHVFCPEEGSPAIEVAWTATTGAYDDFASLDAFASAVDVITYEFENLPVEAFRRMSARSPVRPHWRCLETTQHRVSEKDFVTGLGFSTAPYLGVTGVDDLDRALEVTGSPAILKTARMGYDGKGQVGITRQDDLENAWKGMKGGDAILEGVVDFALEVSAIVARDIRGTIRAFDVVANTHRGGILVETRAPAAIPDGIASRAAAIAGRLAEAFDLVGLLAVEMFLTRDDELLVNELAARPHNSGHWTIDACHTNQFEQFIRAIAGLPLGDPSRHSDAVMTNLIGDDIATWHEIMEERNAKLHLYGKTETKPGRKMGHVTRLSAKRAC